jgi:hypothetical protein
MTHTISALEFKYQSIQQYCQKSVVQANAMICQFKLKTKPNEKRFPISIHSCTRIISVMASEIVHASPHELRAST